jgi:hypothetical protein
LMDDLMNGKKPKTDFALPPAEPVKRGRTGKVAAG